MALTKEEILDAIASMTVLEVSELIKMMGPFSKFPNSSR